MSNYFNTTHLNEWDATHCTEYFNLKYKIEVYGVNGSWLSTAKLNQYRMMFGKSLGEKIYLIIHDRLEREDEVLQIDPHATMPIGSPPWSPAMMPIGSPPWSPATMPVGSPTWSPTTMPIGSPSFILPTPIMSMSNLDLNAFQHTDTRATLYMSSLKKQESNLLDKYDRIRLASHVDKYPPLLWDNTHLHLFLSSIVKHQIPMIPDVDDFIFMTADEINVYFPNKGPIIKSLLLSRFIDPNIKKLHSNNSGLKSLPSF